MRKQTLHSYWQILQNADVKQSSQFHFVKEILLLYHGSKHPKTKQKQTNKNKTTKTHRFQAYSNLKAKSFKILKSKCEVITQKLYSYCTDFILQKFVLYTGKKFCLSFWPNLKGCIVHANMCILGRGRGEQKICFYYFHK